MRTIERTVVKARRAQERVLMVLLEAVLKAGVAGEKSYRESATKKLGLAEPFGSPMHRFRPGI